MNIKMPAIADSISSNVSAYVEKPKEMSAIADIGYLLRADTIEKNTGMSAIADATIIGKYFTTRFSRSTQ